MAYLKRPMLPLSNIIRIKIRINRTKKSRTSQRSPKLSPSFNSRRKSMMIFLKVCFTLFSKIICILLFIVSYLIFKVFLCDLMSIFHHLVFKVFLCGLILQPNEVVGSISVPHDPVDIITSVVEHLVKIKQG
jgi:hypothetical protein